MDDGLNIPQQEPSGAPIDPWMENGDFLVSYLKLLGVEYVFGVPGGAIEPLVNALARAEAGGGPRCVMARHETGAAFMAEGYHSASGRLAVCFATTGPGATNLVTGVASAYSTKTPMLVVTAQTALETFGRGALQESSCTGVNTVAIFGSITRYNSLVSHPDQLEHKLAAAVMAAMRCPRGPAHLSIPIDVLKAPAKQRPVFTNLASLVQRPRLFDALAFAQFYDILRDSHRAVFVIGGEAGEALSAIVEIAEWLQIPLVETPHGKGLVNPYHPLYRGVVGFSGHCSAEEVLRDPDVDLVIAVGASLGEWASNGWDGEALLNSRLVHIAASDHLFAGSPMARLHLWGNIEFILEEVLRRLMEDGLPKRAGVGKIGDTAATAPFHFSLRDAEAYQSDQSPILPQRLMAELPRLFPGNTRYLADSGNSQAWAMHYLHVGSSPDDGYSGKTSSTFNASLDFAPMGWAIGNAVGIALAEPGRPVVCITGDGSFLMSSQEITVAIQQRLPVIFLILNDSAYGMVKHGQMLTGAERVGFSLPAINFADVARAMGVPGFVIHSVADLQALDIDAICTAEGPTLLDVRINAEAMPPIELRVKVLKGAQ